MCYCHVLEAHIRCNELLCQKFKNDYIYANITMAFWSVLARCVKLVKIILSIS